MTLLLEPAIWVSFLSLALLEIILGIDNLVFLSLLTEKLPEAERPRARILGLSLALLMRLGLLFSISWIVGLKEPIAEVMGFPLSWRDVILFGGGLFLLAKATVEIVETLEGDSVSGAKGGAAKQTVRFGVVIAQVVVLDMVFSFDSILTALGLSDHLPVMVAAIVSAMIFMLFAAAPLSDFINRHLSIKILALAFLLLIGAVLVADGLHFHIPKGYIYSSIAFSLFVQGLVLLAKQRKAGL